MKYFSAIEINWTGGQNYAQSLDFPKNEAAEEFYFQPRVLQPGEGESGLIVCDTSIINSNIKGNFRFVVSVNGERHEFAFNRGIAE